MTVSVTTTESPAYAGNGSTTAFSTAFAFDADSWVKVYIYAADGSRTLQTITTHYTLTGEGTGSAGTVTMLTAPATGETLKIFKVPSLDQQVDLVNEANFQESVVEGALDKLTHQVQYLQSQLNRVLKLTGTSTLTDLEVPDVSGQAGKALVVNPDGDGYVYTTIEAGSSVVILDEDDMSTDSATAVPSQQSTKAYVDAQVSAGVGAVELLASGTWSSTTSTDLAMPSGYAKFKLIIEDFQGNGAGNLAARVSTDGVTFDSGATDYDSGGSAANSKIVIMTANGTGSYYAEITILGARNGTAHTTILPPFNVNVDSGNTTATPNSTLWGGSRLTAQLDTHLRLLYVNGSLVDQSNALNGKYYFYGYKSS